MTGADLSDLSSQRGGSQPLRAYVSRPPGEGPWPAVVMLHEIFGLDRQIRGHADRLAAAGYLVVALDLFSDGGARRCLVSTIRAQLRGEGVAFTDVGTGQEWARNQPDCTGKVGVIGFCLGGGFALATAASGFDASAVNYGRLPRDRDVLTGACPIVAHYGDKDLGLRGAGPRLDETLDRLGVVHDVTVYPGARHAFMTPPGALPGPLRPVLTVAGIASDPVAAADAWARIEAWFAEHLH